MVYRIRYIEPQEGKPATQTVEANSPAEAIVKFNVKCRDLLGVIRRDRITSVRAEESGLLPQW